MKTEVSRQLDISVVINNVLDQLTRLPLTTVNNHLYLGILAGFYTTYYA